MDEFTDYCARKCIIRGRNKQVKVSTFYESIYIYKEFFSAKADV